MGVSYPTGDSITNTYNLTEFEEEDNCTTTTTGSIISTDSKVYTLWNDYITKAIALILTLAGALIFIYQPLEQKQVIK